MDEDLLAAYTRVAESLEFRRDNAQRSSDRMTADAENGRRRAAGLEAHAGPEPTAAQLRALSQIRRNADAASNAASASGQRAREFGAAAALLRKTVEDCEREGLVWLSK